jgi:4-hydroxy-4-methyl-2-oxoglutarate aldolase
MAKYDIGEMPEPLPAALVAQFGRIETATVGHTRSWGFMDPGMRPLVLGKHVVGCAITVVQPGSDSTMLHHALGMMRPGDFMLVDRCGEMHYAGWGGGVTLAAVNAGAVGAAVDGLCTDPAEIRAHGFPVWCRGISPVTTRQSNMGGTMNRPIACGGAPVHPGDLVLADETGVLIIPRAEAETVAKEAVARGNRGDMMMKRVQEGEKLGDVSGASRLVAEALRA